MAHSIAVAARCVALPAAALPALIGWGGIAWIGANYGVKDWIDLEQGWELSNGLEEMYGFGAKVGNEEPGREMIEWVGRSGWVWSQESEGSGGEWLGGLLIRIKE